MLMGAKKICLIGTSAGHWNVLLGETTAKQGWSKLRTAPINFSSFLIRLGIKPHEGKQTGNELPSPEKSVKNTYFFFISI